MNAIGLFTWVDLLKDYNYRFYSFILPGSVVAFALYLRLFGVVRFHWGCLCLFALWMGFVALFTHWFFTIVWASI